ncbi:MAG: radical SAM protein [Anaerolineales bacterium]|jgi:SynChlorMet cassette radical SAM/SPASM protein ScmE|nr:radical SAM protein [Anaerolineales bacterium]
MSEMKIMSSPKHVDIAITGKCNLACQYCFYADEMVARGDLPTERWLAFFEELGSLGVMSVTLTGGEVFTRPDLFTLIDGIIANRMRYSLLSNGTLITEETLKQFEIGKRRQRLDSIQISVDGSSAAVHDLSRPKSFGRALRGLKLLKAAGYPVTVRVTINRHNVDDLENVARLLLEEVGLPSFSTNEAYACGATDRTEDAVILTPAQREQAMRVLTQLSEKYNNRIAAQAGPLVLARELKTMDEMMAEGQTSRPGRGKLTSCGGVFSKLAVNHDGTIVPCHILSPVVLGRVGQDSLQDLWLNHPDMLRLRQRQEIPLESLETCQGCAYQGFCSGGCPGGALYANGDYNTRNPESCYLLQRSAIESEMKA